MSWQILLALIESVGEIEDHFASSGEKAGSDLKQQNDRSTLCACAHEVQVKEPNLQPTAVPKKLANREVVVLAAYLAGAGSNLVDTEDIAIQANELAPGRFSWRKHKEQINIEAVRKRLWDATKPEKGAHLIGSEKTGWRLTKAGFDFAHHHLRAGAIAQPAKARASKAERTAQTREIRRMTGEDAFQKLRLGLPASITKSEVERFFRIDDYVTGKARMAKIERFRIIASGNDELAQAIDILSRMVREV